MAMTPLQIGEPLSALLDAHDLVRVFGKSLPTIHRWAKEGKLTRFETRRPLGARRWSGRLIQEHLDGSGTTLAAVRRAG